MYHERVFSMSSFPLIWQEYFCHVSVSDTLSVSVSVFVKILPKLSIPDRAGQGPYVHTEVTIIPLKFYEKIIRPRRAWRRQLDRSV